MKVPGIVLRLALLRSTSAVLLLTVCGAPAAPAQAPAVTVSLDGTWVNVDAKTRGLVQIDIHDKKIHPYGRCHPNPCDWGELKAKSFASSVESTFPAALTAKYTTNFCRSEITLSLEADGRMRAEVFTHFTDASGRSDYRFVDYLKRIRPAYAPEAQASPPPPAMR